MDHITYSLFGSRIFTASLIAWRVIFFTCLVYKLQTTSDKERSLGKDTQYKIHTIVEYVPPTCLLQPYDFQGVYEIPQSSAHTHQYFQVTQSLGQPLCMTTEDENKSVRYTSLTISIYTLSMHAKFPNSNGEL